MASYAVAQAEIGVYQKTLAAATVDTVTITRDPVAERGIRPGVRVWADGTAAVYFTVDGSAPTVAGNNTYELPAGSPVSMLVEGAAPGNVVVKLISAATPKYSVSATQ